MRPDARITIGFKRLEVECLIGTLPHEKQRSQTIRLSVAATLKTCPEDMLATTLDYRSLAEVCRSACEEKHRELIETLAQDILEALVSGFEVQHIKIAIEKPSALEGAACAFVEIESELSVCVGR